MLQHWSHDVSYWGTNSDRFARALPQWEQIIIIPLVELIYSYFFSQPLKPEEMIVLFYIRGVGNKEKKEAARWIYM